MPATISNIIFLNYPFPASFALLSGCMLFGERETDRQTERQRETDRQTCRRRRRERQTDRHTDRKTERQILDRIKRINRHFPINLLVCLSIRLSDLCNVFTSSQTVIHSTIFSINLPSIHPYISPSIHHLSIHPSIH